MNVLLPQMLQVAPNINVTRGCNYTDALLHCHSQKLTAMTDQLAVGVVIAGVE